MSNASDTKDRASARYRVDREVASSPSTGMAECLWNRIDLP